MQLHELLDGLELLDPEPLGPALAADATLERAPFEVRGDPRVDVRSVVHDSRAVQPGALFCSIPGATADGHDFAPAAVNAGAVACLVERWIDVDATLVRTPSVRAAIGPLSSRFFDAPVAIAARHRRDGNQRQDVHDLLARVDRDAPRTSKPA